MNPETDQVIYLLCTIFILFLVFVFFFGFIMKIDAFSRELDYIKREIRRTMGEEQRYWKREKRRLWLSLLPFYRR